MAAEPAAGAGLAALPSYTDIVGVQEDNPDEPRGSVAPRWRYLGLIAVGVLLFAVPVVTGMFTRAAGGQQLLREFEPFVSAQAVDKFRGYLDTVDRARADVLQTHEAAGGQYAQLDSFVTQYPSIKHDLTGLLDAVAGQTDNYRQLRAIGAFDALPFLLAVPGLALIALGAWGLRRAGNGQSTAAPRVFAVAVAALLIAVPFADGLWTRAPAGTRLVDAFTPLLTHDQVSAVQRHFVVLVAAEGELDTRFLGDLRRNAPAVAVPGVDAFVAQWQPMTADFASLIGAMADNIDNFGRVVALDRLTAPLGFRAFDYFGWFFVVPGLVIAALSIDPKGVIRWRAKH